jgi:hypothetical protein
MGEASCRFWFGEWMRGLRPHGWMVAGSVKDKGATEKVQEVIGATGDSHQLVSRRGFVGIDVSFGA